MQMKLISSVVRFETEVKRNFVKEHSYLCRVELYFTKAVADGVKKTLSPFHFFYNLLVYWFSCVYFRFLVVFPRVIRGMQLPVMSISIYYFTTTAEILARSLANFYRQYADRHLNLKFVR